MPVSLATVPSALAQLNAERSRGVTLGPLQVDELAVLQASPYSKLPTCSLDDYRRKAEVSERLLDADRSPYLVVREALELGVHPMVEVLEAQPELVQVGSGVRFGRLALVRVDLPLGCALVPGQSVLIWR